MSTVKMYQLIKKAAPSLDDSEAEALVSEVEKLVNQRFNDRKELLVTKVDLADTEKSLQVEIVEVEKRLRIEMAEMEKRITTNVGDKINRTYRNLLFWIVITGVVTNLPEIIASFAQLF